MGVLIALDIGEKRIGVAASDSLGLLASPVETIARTSDKTAIRAIRRIVEERHAEKVIVGLPKTLRNEVGHQAEKVLRFVEALEKAIPVPIELLDERLTTEEAHRYLREPDAPGRRRTTSRKRQRRVREQVDQVAATLILETYLARQRGPSA